MSDIPKPLARLDEVERATIIGHETIYELKSALVSKDRASPATDVLLTESARITLHEVPAVTEPLRRLAAVWREQRILAPDDARETESKLDVELERVESRLSALLERQAQIAAELRAAQQRGR